MDFEVRWFGLQFLCSFLKITAVLLGTLLIYWRAFGSEDTTVFFFAMLSLTIIICVYWVEKTLTCVQSTLHTFVLNVLFVKC